MLSLPAPIEPLLGFLRFVALRFQRERCAQVAASLTFTTLLALVPLITIALTFSSAFPVFSQFLLQVKLFVLQNVVPQTAGKMVGFYIEQFSENAARLTAAGIALLAVSAIALMSTIDSAFNAIWRVKRQRSWLRRFLIYWAMLTLGPVLVGASLSATYYLIGLSRGWISAVPLAGNLPLELAPLALTTVAFSLLYLAVPNRLVPRSHALIGGLSAALAFELMKHLFAAYLSRVHTYKLVYGAFASFPIFLIWIYCCWLIVLLGAVLAAALSHWHGGRWRVRESPEQRYHDALRLLKVLYESHRTGAVVSLAELRKLVPLGIDEIEDTLEPLIDARVVQPVAGGGYAIVRDPSTIHLADLYGLFVLQREIDASPPENSELAPLLNEISQNVQGCMRLTLDDIFAPPRELSSVGNSELK